MILGRPSDWYSNAEVSLKQLWTWQWVFNWAPFSSLHSIMDLLTHLLAFAGLFLGLLFWYNRWRVRTLTHNSKGISAPKTPGAWPIIGHLHLLSGQVPIFRTLGAMADKHGPVFMIRLGVHRALVVSSREAVKECFTTNDKAFASCPSSSAWKLLG